MKIGVGSNLTLDAPDHVVHVITPAADDLDEQPDQPVTGADIDRAVSGGYALVIAVLDAEGRVWYGSPRRTTKGRSLTWALMDESAEEEPVSEPTTAGPPPTEGAARPWPTKPRP